MDCQTELACDAYLSPALWVFPQIDFDESLGLVAVGNAFGKLVLIDYVGHRFEDLGRSIEMNDHLPSGYKNNTHPRRAVSQCDTTVRSRNTSLLRSTCSPSIK